MTSQTVSRRAVMSTGIAAPLSFSLPPPKAGASPTLDLSSPRAQLTAFMKLFTSLKDETVYYWYSGVLDAALPGEPVRPLIGVDTLIRRRTQPQPDGSLHVTSWEAEVFHTIGDTTIPETIENPVTGRIVQPFPYLEGPMTTVYSEQRPLYMFDPTGKQPPPAADHPFAMQWHQAGDAIWTAREVYADLPHPLDPAVWRLESSGARMQFALVSTHTGKVSELADPKITRASSGFTFECIGGWDPWLLMGQRPGHQVWRSTGLKLPDITMLPAPVRAMFEKVHPVIFTEAAWSESVMPWTEYAKRRQPAT